MIATMLVRLDQIVGNQNNDDAKSSQYQGKQSSPPPPPQKKPPLLPKMNIRRIIYIYMGVGVGREFFMWCESFLNSCIVQCRWKQIFLVPWWMHTINNISLSCLTFSYRFSWYMVFLEWSCERRFWSEEVHPRGIFSCFLSCFGFLYFSQLWPFGNVGIVQTLHCGEFFASSVFGRSCWCWNGELFARIC